MRERPVRVKGMTHLLLENPKTGKIEKYANSENIITETGFQMITQAIHATLSANVTNQIVKYGGLGTGTAAPVSNTTVLPGENTAARMTCAGSSVASKTCQSTWAYATNEATQSSIGCIGLYGSATNSSLIAYATVTPMTKTTSQTLSITYQLRFT